MSEIYGALGNTEYGQILQENVRFGRFKPDFLPNEVWVDLLGADVENYAHMQNTAEITAWYIFEAEKLGSPLTREEQTKLMLTAWVHDFAEAIDGDVPDPHKDHSDDAKAKEKQSFLKVASTVVSDPEALGEAVFPVMYGDGELARHFRAIEIIGYAETAKLAGKQAFNMAHLQEMYDMDILDLRKIHVALLHLHDEVLPNAYEQLGKFADLPVIRSYLDGK